MNSAEHLCANVISETHNFYREHNAALGNRGYEVLYGPPIERPEIFFLGFQPGGDHTTTDHDKNAGDIGWPETSLYATSNWRLATALQEMFGKDLLQKSTGSNAIFFRAPSMKVYYEQTPDELLPKIDSFCRSRVSTIIEALKPKLLLAVGFAALGQFGPTYPVLRSPTGRSLVQVGSIGEREAFATLHLSGARISSADKLLMAQFLRGKLEEAT